MQHKLPTPSFNRRTLLGAASLGVCAMGLWPDVRALASDLEDFLVAPPVKDIEPVQLSKHVWMIFAPDGFPTPENRGMMSNVTFVVTSAGVVVLDSGARCRSAEWPFA